MSLSDRRRSLHRAFNRAAQCLPGRRRRLVLCGLVAIVCLVPSLPAGAQEEAPEATGLAQNLTVTTGDGWNIALTYYAAKTGREAPVVVLLHMMGGNRLIWNDGFAKQLVDAGYAVIAVDLRGHGESKPPGAALAASGKGDGGKRELRSSDYQAMVTQDLEAVKQFIYEEHEREALNMRKMAILAPEASAPIALNYALFDWLKPPYNDAPTFALRTPRGQDVRALALVSPNLEVRGMNANRAIRDLRNPQWGISFYVGFGGDNEKDKEEAEKLYEKLTHIESNKERMYLIDYPVKLRGTDLFGQGLNIEDNIITFLNTHVKALPDPWRDRKSVLSD